MKILLIEDEKGLSDIIKEMLINKHYLVDAVYDGEEAYHYGKDDAYDLILLDVLLPKMDGFSILHKLRQEQITTPIIMLTAKSDVDDKVQGLDYGADDYITKPFDPKELLARIASALRRKDHSFSDLKTFGDLVLDKDDLTIKAGMETFSLSVKEFQILEMLIIHQTTIVPREKMLIKIWGYDFDGDSNIVDVYISVIRKKLKSIGSKEKIKTVRSVGYRMEHGDD